MSQFLVGAVLGALVTVLFGALVVADMSRKTISLNECRAANPGHDCDLGWVRGEPWQ